jgi:hypothetical protein
MYVQRDAAGAIVGAFANPQESLELQELPDDAPEVVAFLAEQRRFIDPRLGDVPLLVTNVQIKLALDQLGLLDAIEAYVAKAPRAVQIRWSEGRDFYRTDRLIAAAASTLGKSDADVDDLFRLAATV